MHLCLILNGPPGVGKDTIAGLLGEYGFKQHAFKTALYEETAKHYKVPLDAFLAVATDREKKEQIWEETGESPRQMLIHTSEDIIKPEQGSDFFGRRAAARCMETQDPLVVFSDGGFVEEIPPLMEVFQHVLIVRLYRDGYDFSNDSREYLQQWAAVNIRLQDGYPERAVADILFMVNPLLDALGAKT